MAHDGFSLDDKRVKVEENDISDILECWKRRFDADFQSARAKRIADLRRELTPLKEERVQLQAEMNRLQFESVVRQDIQDGQDGKNQKENPVNPVHPVLIDAQTRPASIQSQIAPLQAELDRLTHQFWVTKEQVKANKYDLSASRYRQVESDAAYHERPAVTLERLARLEQVRLDEIEELKKKMKNEV